MEQGMQQRRVPCCKQRASLSSSEWASVSPGGRGGAAGSKRAGGTGMSQEELAAMDPKRVKRIIANRQVRACRAAPTSR